MGWSAPSIDPVPIPQRLSVRALDAQARRLALSDHKENGVSNVPSGTGHNQLNGLLCMLANRIKLCQFTPTATSTAKARSYKRHRIAKDTTLATADGWTIVLLSVPWK